MGRWVRTLGKSIIAVAVCDRCHKKFPTVELSSDPNFPGLKVCAKDRDVFDPWRLPARPPDNITLPFVRPDEDLSLPAPVEVETATRITEDDLIRITEDDLTRIIE
jgi:hypothetical protein